LIELWPATAFGINTIVKNVLGPVEIHHSTSIDQCVEMLQADIYQLVIIGPGLKNLADLQTISIHIKMNRHVYVVAFVNAAITLSLIELVRLFGTGIKGLLNPDAEVKEIGEIVHSAFNGTLNISEKLKMEVLYNYILPTEKKGPAVIVVKLSRKEAEIAKLLVAGWRNKQIAEAFNLVPTTISTFKLKIFRKMKVRNVIELATRLALEV